jgi:sulfite reductase (NADPH) flavoprotein alpha-component
LDQRQALWLSGYLAAGAPAAAPQAAPTPSNAVLIAYGGETGNSESIAQVLAEQALQQGIRVDVQDLAKLRIRQLSKRKHLLLICSTHGDGDPPEPVVPFYDALMADNAPRLEGLQFSVLALGDSSYEHFCVTGQQLDERLEALGGTRLHPRQECDVDFDEPAARWGKAVREQLPRSDQRGATSTITTAPAHSALTYSKRHPLSVEVLENLNLSHPQRTTPIHHLELALETPDFTLAPGDAVGVLADNPPALVAAVLDACHLSGEAPVTLQGESMPLVQALRQHQDLTIPSTRFLEQWAQLSNSPILKQQLKAPSKVQRQYLKTVQVLDLLRLAPATPDPHALVDALRPLQPRLYDVANSLEHIDDELHLNVKAYRYDIAGRQESGIASQYLLTLEPGDTVRIYPHRNARFHLPDDPHIPVILIAEGTGIAPYRAFIQALAQTRPKQPCWLVFAEQQFEQDFLYQTEFQQARQDGVLDKVDTLFYQDQPGKALASSLLEQAERLQEWIKSGAHLYFCGDKQRLTDCEKSLFTLFDADTWKQLGKDKRLHRNLY